MNYYNKFLYYFQLDMNVYSVWRFMLDENEKLGRARLATVQMIQVRKFDNIAKKRRRKWHVATQLAKNICYS